MATGCQVRKEEELGSWSQNGEWALSLQGWGVRPGSRSCEEGKQCLFPSSDGAEENAARKDPHRELEESHRHGGQLRSEKSGNKNCETPR